MASIDFVPSQFTRGNPVSFYDTKLSLNLGEGMPSSTLPQGQYTDLEVRLGPAYKLELSGQSKAAWSDSEIRRMKQTGKIECQTCKERQYQDGSNDPGVSFKTPGHISPESSAAVVQAHEQEHVSNEQANARSEGRKVVSQSVQLFSAVCPECGKVYVSGGETRTTTATDNKQLQLNEVENTNNKVDLRV